MVNAKYKDFLPLAQKYAAKYGLELSYILAQIDQESAFNPQAVSSCGASGLMQIMPATAQDIASALNEPVGNLSDPETSIKYGTFYLHQLYLTFNSMTLALAAYNAGPGSVGKYGTVPPYPETQAYVKRINEKQLEYAAALKSTSTAAPVPTTPTKPQDYKLSKYIWRSEAECHCCNKIGDDALHLQEMLKRLDKLRDYIKKPLFLTCLRRCPAHNAAVGGVSNSLHLTAAAADCYTYGMTVDQLAAAAEKFFPGVLKYYDQGFVHVDIRDVKFTGSENRSARQIINGEPTPLVIPDKQKGETKVIKWNAAWMRLIKVMIAAALSAGVTGFLAAPGDFLPLAYSAIGTAIVSALWKFAKEWIAEWQAK